VALLNASETILHLLSTSEGTSEGAMHI
jgi:hypothetical protein